MTSFNFLNKLITSSLQKPASYSAFQVSVKLYHNGHAEQRKQSEGANKNPKIENVRLLCQFSTFYQCDINK